MLSDSGRFYLIGQVLDSKVFYQGDENGGSSVHGIDQINEASILYCERFMEFLIDLLSQLPTRRLVLKFGYFFFTKLNYVFVVYFIVCCFIFCYLS